MLTPNPLLLLAIATLLYASYSEAAEISPQQRPVVKAKAAVNDIPANIVTLDRCTLDRRYQVSINYVMTSPRLVTSS